MNVLLVPEDCGSILPIKLPDPKGGELQQYFYDEDNLSIYESINYYDKFRSWFLDDQLVKDGHFNMLTRVDPLYLFLPQLEKYASKQFRSIDDICSTFAESSNGEVKIEYALSPSIDWELICETKELDNVLYIRYDESKTLNWLEKKHSTTMEALQEMIDSQHSKATLISYSSDLIDQYLPPFISDKFKNHVKNNYSISSTNTTNIATTATTTTKMNNTLPKQQKPGSKVQQSGGKKEVPKGSILQFFNKK